MIDNITLIKLIENEPRLYQKELMTEAAESIQQHIEQHNKAYHYYRDCPWAMKQLGKKGGDLIRQRGDSGRLRHTHKN